MANGTQNPYFEGVRAGLEEMISALETGRRLTCRTIRLPEGAPNMSAKEIANLRQEKLHLSQNVFASVLNVSLKTVQAWEQGRNTPCGPALRLLWLLAARPDMLQPILAAPETLKHEG